MNLILAIFGIFNIVFLLVVVSQRLHIAGWTTKIMLFVGMVAFPLLWGFIVMQQNLAAAQETDFCAKCHVMEPYTESLKVDDDEPLSAVHYQNNWVPQEKACYSCHTEYSMFGPVKAKLTGLRHIYVNYIKGAPEKLKLYAPYNNRECLKCHGPAKKFLKHKKHNRPKGVMQEMLDNKKSCLAKGCHELGHLLASDMDDDEDDF